MPKQGTVAPPRPPNLMLEGAEVKWTNFMGRATDYNSEGDRNFCVFFDEEMAGRLEREGWNVKRTNPREEGDEPRPYLQIKVEYNKGRPPGVHLIKNQGTKRVELTPDTVGILDAIDTSNWDLVISPSPWGPINGNVGIAAYLKQAFVTVDENAIELKYMDLEADQDPTTSSSIANEED